MSALATQWVPAGFVWGAATSAYQIEGAWDADGRGESIWDRFSHTPGIIGDGTNGDSACDHYHRWPEDIALMRAIGLGAYRFSIAWPRIQPTGRGPANSRGLDFYDRLVDGLLEAGIAPFVTLFHWDLPQALQDRGGWASRETIDAFVEYADLVSRRLGDRVASWSTHNEPWVFAFGGHEYGWHAPGLKGGPVLQVAHNMLVGHGLATEVLRANAPAAEVGIVLNMAPAHPAGASAQDALAARRVWQTNNDWFIDPLFGRGYPAEVAAIYEREGRMPVIAPGDFERMAAPVDFIGINYYFRNVVRYEPGYGPFEAAVIQVEGAERTGMDWEVYPDGLREMIVDVHSRYAPAKIYVMENGMVEDDSPTADGAVHDRLRISYFERHLAKVAQAIDEGAPVAGYFAWSLLDNFEWGFGLAKRFGLIYVDFATQRRILKDSALFYRDLIAAHNARALPTERELGIGALS